MAVELEQIVGPAVRTDGLSDGPVRVDHENSAVVRGSHGRYFEAARRGRLFMACNSASQALSLNSTTATGIILTNPVNSGVNLSIVDLCVALLTAPAGISNLILSGQLAFSGTAVTQTTPLTVRPALIGGPGASVGLAASAATLVTNTILRPVGGGPVATGSVTSPFIRDEIAGSIVLSPGTAISLQCLTTAISVVASLTWEEVAL